MKLLVITQAVDRNDDVLGYFHTWLGELAKHCGQLTVICLRQGEYSLPDNVTILSLGKESGPSRLKYLGRLAKYLWRHHRDYDRVFVHMNPIYIVLAGWWWRLTGKSIALWYTHRQVDFKLRVSALLANIIFTAAPESFRLKNSKVNVVGHGIDVNAFACEAHQNNQLFTILHIGRLTPIKNCDILIEAAGQLRAQLTRPFKVIFIGSAVTATDHDYELKLKEQVKNSGLEEVVAFAGSVPNRLMRDYYCQADLTVNLTPTGGIDKAVLESMAAGVPVLTSNQAFRDYFGHHASALLFAERNSGELSQKMKRLIECDLDTVGAYLQQVARERADVGVLIKKIISLWR